MGPGVHGRDPDKEGEGRQRGHLDGRPAHQRGQQAVGQGQPEKETDACGGGPSHGQVEAVQPPLQFGETRRTARHAPVLCHYHGAAFTREQAEASLQEAEAFDQAARTWLQQQGFQI